MAPSSPSLDWTTRTVQSARREGLAREISSLTGLSLGAVRSRLSRAHGQKLLCNLFADAWPQPAQYEQARGARTSPPRAPRQQQAADAARTIHRVRQEFTTSCGVAVVAMFARVSHDEAMAVLFPDQQRRSYGTHLYQLKRALDHFGVRYGPSWHRFRSWEEIPSTSLVRVKWELNGRRGQHWVIFQRRANGTWDVIDPDRRRTDTLRLTELERRVYTGISYLPVQARVRR